MKLNFRQGIIKARSISFEPDYLAYQALTNTVTIDISSPELLVTAALGEENYLIQESATRAYAWGPFTWQPAWGETPATPTYWLYWDINLASAAVTRGYTHSQPILSYVAPVNPLIDQHWFDLTHMKTFVWSGTEWVLRIRVFAGSLTTTLPFHMPFGTQVGVETTENEFIAGFIVLGADGKGVKLSDGNFLTTADPVLLNQGKYSSPIKLEALNTSMEASEPIPAMSLVSVAALGFIQLASSSDIDKRAIGLIDVDLPQGQIGTLITEGVIFDDQWTWDLSLGKDLYCGPYGELVQGPSVNTLGSNGQKVGTILTETSILLAIDMLGATTGSPGTGPTGPRGATGPGVTGPLGPTGPTGAVPATNVYNYSASQNLLTTHAAGIVLFDATSGVNYTIEQTVFEALAVGATIVVGQKGTGQVTIVPYVGLTILSPETLKTRKQHGKITLMKTAAATLELEGNLELA